MKYRLLKMGVGTLGSITMVASVVACTPQDTSNETYQMLEQLVENKNWAFTGTSGALRMRNFIKKELVGYGYANDKIVEENFTYDLKWPNWAEKLVNHSDYWKINTKTWKEMNDAQETATGIPGVNLYVDIPGKSTDDNVKNKIIGIGAHYDLHVAYNEKLADGANDNLSGIASMLSIAKFAIKNPADYTLRLIFWDAEESGRRGSIAHIEKWKQRYKESDKLVGYINLDSVAGGDQVYLGHGIANDPKSGTNGSKTIYEGLKKSAEALNLKIESANVQTNAAEGQHKYIKGEMYPASDHVSFNIEGFEIAGFESTSYNVPNKGGEKDGYQQTANPKFWFAKPNTPNADKGIKGGPLNEEGVNSDGYERDQEAGWGRIWHTNFDTLKNLNEQFGTRLNDQLSDVYQTVTHFIQNFKLAK